MTHWVICPDCRGEGKHSMALGAMSREEFDRDFTYEEQESYIAGGYDRTCDMCGGSGKVRTQGYKCPSCGNEDRKLIRELDPDYDSLDCGFTAAELVCGAPGLDDEDNPEGGWECSTRWFPEQINTEAEARRFQWRERPSEY